MTDRTYTAEELDALATENGKKSYTKGDLHDRTDDALRALAAEKRAAPVGEPVADFSWALSKVKRGNAIRRSAWKPGKQVRVAAPHDGMSYLELIYLNGLRAPWSPTRCDLFEKDWTETPLFAHPAAQHPADVREAVKKAIMLEVQCHDFGHCDPETGDFKTNPAKIELLDAVCAKAADRILAALPAETPAQGAADVREADVSDGSRSSPTTWPHCTVSPAETPAQGVGEAESDELVFPPRERRVIGRVYSDEQIAAMSLPATPPAQPSADYARGVEDAAKVVDEWSIGLPILAARIRALIPAETGKGERS